MNYNIQMYPKIFMTLCTLVLMTHAGGVMAQADYSSPATIELEARRAAIKREREERIRELESKRMEELRQREEKRRSWIAERESRRRQSRDDPFFADRHDDLTDR